MKADLAEGEVMDFQTIFRIFAAIGAVVAILIAIVRANSGADRAHRGSASATKPAHQKMTATVSWFGQAALTVSPGARRRTTSANTSTIAWNAPSMTKGADGPIKSNSTPPTIVAINIPIAPNQAFVATMVPRSAAEAS